LRHREGWEEKGSMEKKADLAATFAMQEKRRKCRNQGKTRVVQQQKGQAVWGESEKEGKLTQLARTGGKPLPEKGGQKRGGRQSIRSNYSQDED